MICRLRGQLEDVGEDAAVVAVGGLSYEVLMPRAALGELQHRAGEEVGFVTLHYLEGSAALGHLVPRIVGFLTESDRRFFGAFTKVKNVGVRKALRAMSVPVHQLAAAIERGDERFLSSLPEIGKRTASQIIAQLRGQLQSFCVPTAASAPLAELTDPQRLAVDILVQWGDRRVDAERWVKVAVEADGELSGPDEIVRAAYRVKNRAG